MSSPQSSNQIHYTSKEAWEEYLNKMKELLSIVSGIRALKDRLDRELKRPLSELADNETYLKLLFGGVVFEKGRVIHLDKSLAKIVFNLFNVGILDDELARIGYELESGKELKKLNIVPKSDETKAFFMKNIDGLWISLSNILQIKTLNTREYKIDDLSNALTDLINAMGPLLPTYNELSFFIYSLSGAPRFYIYEEYPEFSNTDTFQPIDDFKIKLETILRDPLGRDQFSIVGIKSGPGKYVIDSINYMFNIFHILKEQGVYDGDEELYKYVKLYYNTSKTSAMGVDMNATSAMGVDMNAVTFFDPYRFCGDKIYLNIKGNGNVDFSVGYSFIGSLPYDRSVVALAPAMFTHLIEVNIDDTRFNQFYFRFNNNIVKCSEVLK